MVFVLVLVCLLCLSWASLVLNLLRYLSILGSKFVQLLHVDRCEVFTSADLCSD
jgi:hypothetical protein